MLKTLCAMAIALVGQLDCVLPSTVPVLPLTPVQGQWEFACSSKEDSMRRRRFSEEQIIGLLKEAEARGTSTGNVSPARDQRRDVSPLEGNVRRPLDESSGWRATD